MKSFLAPFLLSPVASVPQLKQSILRSTNIATLQDGIYHVQTAHRSAFTDIGFYVVLVLLILAIIGLIAKAAKGPPRPTTKDQVVAAFQELDQAEIEANEALAAITAKQAEVRKDEEFGEVNKEQLKEKMKAKDEKVSDGEVEKHWADLVPTPWFLKDDGNEEPPIDYEGALRMFAQSVAQTVGPKIAKGQAVKNILESRVQTLADQSKSFLMDEMTGTAGAVLNELGAQEAMLLLDPKAALENSFPPLSVVLAGLFSPIIIALTAVNHLAQALAHFLPIICLLVAALVIDNGQSCPGIPSLTAWLYAHLIVSGLLFFSHMGQLVKIAASKASLQSELQQKADHIKLLAKEVQNGDVVKIRDMFIETTVLVQRALQKEDAIRRSCWAGLIGFLTFVWLVLSIWTLVIVLMTIYPGSVSFHRSSQAAAGPAFCGCWMTVLAARLVCIIGVFFLLINIGVISAFFADRAKYDPSFCEAVLAEARKIDMQAGGIPVVQTLVKAFVLRGTTDTLELQVATSQLELHAAQQAASALQSEYSAVESELASEVIMSRSLEAKKQALNLPDRTFTSVKPSKSRELTVGDVEADAGPTLKDSAMSAAQQAYEAAMKQYELTQKALDDLIEQTSDMKEKMEQVYAAAKKGDLQAIAKLDPKWQAWLDQVIAGGKEAMAKKQELESTFQAAIEEKQKALDSALQAAGDMSAEKKKALEKALQETVDAKRKALDSALLAAGDISQEQKKALEIAMQEAGDNAEDKKKAMENALQSVGDISAEQKKALESALQAASDDALAKKKALDSALSAIGDISLEKQKEMERALQAATDDALARKKQLDDSLKAAGDEVLARKKALESALEAAKQGNFQELDELNPDLKLGSKLQQMQEIANAFTSSRKAEALALAEQTRQELEKMLEMIMQKIKDIRESPQFKQAQEAMRKKAEEAAELISELQTTLAETEIGKAIKAGDRKKLMELGFSNMALARQRAMQMVEEAKKAAMELADSDDFKDLQLAAQGDEGALERLKKKAGDSLDVEELKKVAQRKMEDMKAQVKAAAARAKEMADQSGIGKALAELEQMSGDALEAKLKELGLPSVEEAKQRVQKLVDEGKAAVKKAQDEFDASDVGKAILSGDPEALKKAGFDSLEAAKKAAQEKMVEAQKMAVQLREDMDALALSVQNMADQSDFCKQLAELKELQGDPEALKKKLTEMGMKSIEEGQLRVKALAEEAKRALEEAQKLMDASPLGKQLKELEQMSGEALDAKLKELGLPSVEEAKKKVQEQIEEVQRAAVKAREAMQDSELGRAIASGDEAKLKELGFETLATAKTQAEADVKKAVEEAKAKMNEVAEKVKEAQ